jgi:hypothetical protein
MSNEHLEQAVQPKGFYMIFVVDEKNAMMGRLIGLTSTAALIHPWNFMFGGIDEHVTKTVVLDDYKEFLAFDNLLDMDEYFDANHWSYMTGKKLVEGVTNE